MPTSHQIFLESQMGKRSAVSRHWSSSLSFINSFQAPICPSGIAGEEMLPQKNTTNLLEANPHLPATHPGSSEMRYLLPGSKKPPLQNFHLGFGQLALSGLAAGCGEAAPA